MEKTMNARKISKTDSITFVGKDADAVDYEVIIEVHYAHT
jgi:hypothetical protein